MMKLPDWIPHSASLLGEPELRNAEIVIRRNFVGAGKELERLEHYVSERTNRRYVRGVLSGTQALILALLALDLPSGSTIAIPVLTCGNLLHAVLTCGFSPCLVDVNEDLAINTEAIPSGCAAVIAPHAYGAPVDTAHLERLGIPWIEDCATSPDTVTPYGMVAGSSGTISIFSFSSTKYLTGGNGGLVCTDDDDIAARIGDLLDPDRMDRHGDWRFRLAPSMPGRMSDLTASVILAQFQHLPEFTAKRCAIGERYDTAFEGLSELVLRKRQPGHALYRYVVRTTHPSELYCEHLHQARIDARTSVNPWLDDLCAGLGIEVVGAYPVASSWKGHLLSLPVHPGMTNEEVERVIAAVKSLSCDLHLGKPDERY